MVYIRAYQYIIANSFAKTAATVYLAPNGNVIRYHVELRTGMHCVVQGDDCQLMVERLYDVLNHFLLRIS